MTKKLAMAIDASIDGEWLRAAVADQGDTMAECAEKLELSYNTTVYNHVNNKHYLGSKLLAGLAIIYPTMNLHFVITGKGPMRLPQTSPTDALLADLRALLDKYQ